MFLGNRIIIVMPAYNAGRTLETTFNELPHDIIDEVIIVDDASHDDTIEVAKTLGIKHIVRHEKNRGYGGNQKTCYDKALELKADVIIMVHPDYQYTPRLIPSMASLITSGLYDVVLGSRILGNNALKGGMPLYKFIANRILTFTQNLIIGEKLSEYHTGYRAYHRRVLESIKYHHNSDNFIFDNQLLSQVLMAGFSIGEVSCPTRYTAESSSINLSNSIRYGLGVLQVSIIHRLSRWGWIKSKLYRD